MQFPSTQISPNSNKFTSVQLHHYLRYLFS